LEDDCDYLFTTHERPNGAVRGYSLDGKPVFYVDANADEEDIYGYCKIVVEYEKEVVE